MLSQALRLTDTTNENTVSSLLTLYSELKALYPKAVALERLPLDFLPSVHPEFSSRLLAYMQTRLKKGLPSLFRDIRGLYVDETKAQARAVLYFF